MNIPTRQIVTDSNEACRSPLLFHGVPPEKLHPPFRLDVGDYALVGLEMWCPIEFKTIHDLAGCCAQRRKHFYNQLIRLAQWEHSHVVIGATIQDILAGKHETLVSPQSILGTLSSYITEFPKVGFHFTSMDRNVAASWVRELLCKGERAFEEYRNPKVGKLERIEDPGVENSGEQKGKRKARGTKMAQTAREQLQKPHRRSR